MRALFLDTEGNGTPSEVGALIYDTKKEYVTDSHSSILPHELASVDPICKKRHEASIGKDLVLDGTNPMTRLMNNCDIIIAHSIYPDRMRMSHIVKIDSFKAPWMCTVKDFNWPIPHNESRSLDNLCRIFKITPMGRHTAFGDCHTLLQCMLAVPNYEAQLAAFIGQPMELDVKEEAPKPQPQPKTRYFTLDHTLMNPDAPIPTQTLPVRRRPPPKQVWGNRYKRKRVEVNPVINVIIDGDQHTAPNSLALIEELHRQLKAKPAPSK
jgi:hypothetical protein